LGGLERIRVVPISTQESGRRARRPANSVLENRRLIESHLGALPNWKEGLAHYLKEGRRLREFVLPAPESGEEPLQGEVTGL
jgi:dTDP-4-dehydrorhamnose reductase